ncbi:MAG: decarboxylase [bacterium]|nr:decarboxylase [bacterium]
MDSARFIMSRSKLLEQYNKIKEYADLVSYSAKTNYDIAEILEDVTDSHFSIHSLESLNKIGNKKRVWFLAQAWNEEELTRLFSTGVRNFIVDNENDLNALLEFIEKHEKKVNLLLRMRLKENTIHTGKYFVFGMYAEQINKFIPELRTNKQIASLGLHFHRKTQNTSEWSLKYELESAVLPEIIQNIDFVCMGGGIPVKYKNFRADLLDNIFNEIKTLKEWLNQNNTKLIIEPGRFISAPAIKLETTIKNIYNNNIIINCSVYNSAMDTFVANIKLEVEGELETGTAFTIKGQTPCSMDIFRYKVFLDNPKIGDKLVFLNAGAYNFSSDFCNLNKLRTDIVD